MINYVSVINHADDVLVMDLADPESSGFAIKKISGLSQDCSQVNITDISSIDGGFFNSARTNVRNIVLELTFVGDDIELIRNRSYWFFPVKKEIVLLFGMDHKQTYISGIVESNTVDIFSKEEGCIVSILCPDPHFYLSGSSGIQSSSFSAITPTFEFPFSNESLVDAQLELAMIDSKTLHNIFYDGDCTVGARITIHANGPATNISLYNVTSEEKMVIDTKKLNDYFHMSVDVGDDIVIDTNVGSKGAYFIKGGTKPFNIVSCLGKYTEWITLQKGLNTMAYTAETGEQNLMITIQNKVAYEGI